MSPPPVANIRLLVRKILALALTGLDRHIAACLPNRDVSSVSFNFRKPIYVHDRSFIHAHASAMLYSHGRHESDPLDSSPPAALNSN
jgi:hypothetical protein